MQDYSLRVIPFALIITAAHLLTIQGAIADDRAYEVDVVWMKPQTSAVL